MFKPRRKYSQLILCLFCTLNLGAGQENSEPEKCTKASREELLGDDGMKLLQELAREREIRSEDHKEQHLSKKKMRELWDYHDDIGPGHWHTLHEDFMLCNEGQAQSPIDIPANTNKSNLNVTFDYTPSSIGLFNDGKTVYVNYFGKAKILLKGRKYKLVRLLMRTPSEHHIDGREYPMEIQFYHRSADQGVAMVSVFVQPGEKNPLLEQIWNVMPEHLNRENVVREKTFDGNKLLPEDRTFYFYSGSLTTPPCTENVQWIIFSNPIQASPEQLEIFSAILNNNTRPLQERNNRPIRIDS